MKLEISLFRFDKNSDYLPYYTKHFLKITNEKSILDILNTINSDSTFGYENCENFDLVINGVYTKASLSLKDLVENFGKEITIEPISIRRAYNDLIIDEKDFEAKLELLADFIDEEDEINYKNLKNYYYASNTVNYKADYIGDSVLILAYELIEKHPKLKKAILEKIMSAEVGASYYTSLKNRILNFDLEQEKKIHHIQEELGFRETLEKQNFRINNTLIIDFGNFEENYEIKHDFKDFNLAYYSNNDTQTQNLIDKLSAKNLKLDSLKLDLAKNTFNKNPEITYRVACTILLDAFDNNADFLVVDNNEDFYVFDYNRKELERICGREVILPVIHKSELQKLACGKHDEARKTLTKHKIDPEII